MTPQARQPALQSPLAGELFRPAALVYLGVCLLALAAGLWADRIRPVHGLRAAPLPVLSALAVGQTLYLLLIHPIILARRQMVLPAKQCPGRQTLVLVVLALLAGPLYVVAVWLSDAVIQVG